MKTPLPGSKPIAQRVVRLYLQGFGTQEMARLTRWTEPRCRNLLYRGLADLKAGMMEQDT